MLIQVLILIAGLALIVFGADFLVDGAASVARRTGLSEFVIGFTIVGFGTSAPEMVVSFMGSIRGLSDIAIGNVIGSNIFNTLLILGLTAVLMPIAVTRDNIRKDIPVNIGVSMLLAACCFKPTIGRIDAAIFLILFAAYMYLTFKQGAQPEDNGEVKQLSWLMSILMIAGGLAFLIFGGQALVGSATKIASGLGVSDKFIAITVLAFGTSLPELATCVVAAAKKKGQLALGNILGSNVFNILLILGGSAMIRPVALGNIDYADTAVLVISAVVLLIAALLSKERKIGRVAGLVMLCGMGAYLTHLFMKL